MRESAPLPVFWSSQNSWLVKVKTAWQNLGILDLQEGHGSLLHVHASRKGMTCVRRQKDAKRMTWEHTARRYGGVGDTVGCIRHKKGRREALAPPENFADLHIFPCGKCYLKSEQHRMHYSGSLSLSCPIDLSQDRNHSHILKKNYWDRQEGFGVETGNEVALLCKSPLPLYAA